MIDEFGERTIVNTVAEQAAQRITRKVIAALQKLNQTLSGDDSELETTWDEICAQVQFEQSVYWDVYDETVRDLVESLAAKLPKHERGAIWLQTDPGFDWLLEDSNVREAYPVSDEDIVDYLTREYIYVEADRWTNDRIRAFLDRSTRSD